MVRHKQTCFLTTHKINIHENYDLTIFCTQPYNTTFVIGTMKNYLSGKLGLANFYVID